MTFVDLWECFSLKKFGKLPKERRSIFTIVLKYGGMKYQTMNQVMRMQIELFQDQGYYDQESKPKSVDDETSRTIVRMGRCLRHRRVQD